MRFNVAYGIPGYGPELAEDWEPLEGWQELASYLSDELSRCADYAEDVARGFAEFSNYEAAWKEHMRAESLDILSRNLSPSRMNAPLYRDNEPLWEETVQRIVEENFPVDVGESSRLYVWEYEGEESSNHA